MINKTQLKSYFETGDKPTQEQFYELIDSIPCEFPSLDFSWGDNGALVTEDWVPTTTYFGNPPNGTQVVELHKKLLKIDFQSDNSRWLEFDPVLEIFRYRSKKVVLSQTESGYHRRAGFIREALDDAEFNARPNEVGIVSTSQEFDIKPEKYFTYNTTTNQFKARGRKPFGYKRGPSVYNFVKFRIRLTDSDGRTYFSPLTETIAIEAIAYNPPINSGAIRLDVTYNRV